MGGNEKDEGGDTDNEALLDSSDDDIMDALKRAGEESDFDEWEIEEGGKRLIVRRRRKESEKEEIRKRKERREEEGSDVDDDILDDSILEEPEEMFGATPFGWIEGGGTTRFLPHRGGQGPHEHQAAVLYPQGRAGGREGKRPHQRRGRKREFRRDSINQHGGCKQRSAPQPETGLRPPTGGQRSPRSPR